MISRIKDISFYCVFGYALAAASDWLKSPFLVKFLTENLIVVLVAVLAINTTTGSVVMTKLREISDKTSGDFSRTVEELRRSLIEQVWCVVIALAASMVYSSTRLRGVIPWPDITIGGLLASAFVASMYNLYDTAQSIFVILRHEQDGKS